MNILEELHKIFNPRAILHSQNDNEIRLERKNRQILLDVHLKAALILSQVLRISCHFRHMVLRKKHNLYSVSSYVNLDSFGICSLSL